MTPIPEAFKLQVADVDIADLKARLERTRFPDQAPDGPWAYGADLAYMRMLVDYWRTEFDWRAQEKILNSFPQFKVNLHGIGQRGVCTDDDVQVDLAAAHEAVNLHMAYVRQIKIQHKTGVLITFILVLCTPAKIHADRFHLGAVPQWDHGQTPVALCGITVELG